MPIQCSVPLQALTQAEFGALSYEVMREVFALHKELGRFFNERIYKQALAARRRDVELEVAVDVTYESFVKRYRLDVLVARGGLLEFKAADGFVARHRAQLIHYLLLTELGHGLLVNVRPEQVEREFINSTLTRPDRHAYEVDVTGWDTRIPGAERLREVVLSLLGDWGSCLELGLYEEAVTHFLGGEAVVLRRVPVTLDGQCLGEQMLRLVDEGVAYKLTALEDDIALERFLSHAKRLRLHTGLAAFLWVNLSRHCIKFTTVK